MRRGGEATALEDRLPAGERPADRRHRVGGIEIVGERFGLSIRQLVGEPAVSMKIERSELRLGKGPTGRLDPASAMIELPRRGLAARPAAHQEQPDRRLAVDAVRFSLQPTVEPSPPEFEPARRNVARDGGLFSERGVAEKVELRLPCSHGPMIKESGRLPPRERPS